MISRYTIDKIMDAARIEEVVGDFITLKKRGVNLIGRCPFHGEKTPSFTVSPVKGIFKCFGCGKSGNSVGFVMEHESFSYPEALKFLARKYNIEIEEKEFTPEEKEKQSVRESLLIVSEFAGQFFQKQLRETDEGLSVGLGYFKKRGFSDEIIQKFALGYSPEDKRAFSTAALKAGYKVDYLIQTGLSILPERNKEEKNIEAKHLIDRYTGRVIFPIHSITGNIIGFGGRILVNDKKMAKYVNSPQSEIYDKSKVLYGLYQAKKKIVQDDNCYLVEGYTDVVSMHLCGVENVVASSGTSLTTEQIKLIHRFTKNITVLYDGDFAGIKASFRGIDMILEEGMNVKVLLFPDGEDPDSYSKKVGEEAFRAFIQQNAQDFLRFKLNLLMDESANDPIKRAELIKDMINSISLIPDSVARLVYIQTCASLMNMAEQFVVFEVNKLRIGRGLKESKDPEKAESFPIAPIPVHPAEPTGDEKQDSEHFFDICELHLLRLMLQYGRYLVEVKSKQETEEEQYFEISLAEYLIYELAHDELGFINPNYRLVFEEYIQCLVNETIPEERHFTHHANPVISSVAIQAVSDEYVLSQNWTKKYNILVGHETHDIKKTTAQSLYIYKDRRLMQLFLQEQEKLKTTSDEEEINNILITLNHLNNLKKRVNQLLGRVVIK